MHTHTHMCHIHNVEYEDFCVLCSGPPHLHPKLKAFLWVVLVLAFLAAFLIYNLTEISSPVLQ